MTGPRLTLVTIAVESVHATMWAWTVDGPVGTDHGTAPTEGQAWADARHAAVAVMGRLEAPEGGHELRQALSGAPVPPRSIP